MGFGAPVGGRGLAATFNGRSALICPRFRFCLVVRTEVGCGSNHKACCLPSRETEAADPHPDNPKVSTFVKLEADPLAVVILRGAQHGWAEPNWSLDIYSRSMRNADSCAPGCRCEHSGDPQRPHRPTAPNQGKPSSLPEYGQPFCTGVPFPPHPVTVTPRRPPLDGHLATARHHSRGYAGPPLSADCPHEVRRPSSAAPNTGDGRRPRRSRMLAVGHVPPAAAPT